jgi:anthranilate phosphoribosyltransferase
MKQIAPVRAALGVRTVFNILGPLTNPAAPPFGLFGAFSVPMTKLMAEALSGMPHVERAFVVHGEPGWDEATPVGRFELFDVHHGRVHREQRDPRDVGIARCKATDLQGGDAKHNAEALETVLIGREFGPHRDALLLGAGLLLEVTGRARTLETGIKSASAAIDNGDAKKLLRQLRAFSESLQ